MDRKIEDKIAMLAFGELSEAESTALRAELEKNADTAQALESYESLRSDLRRLRDVPPDQLSKERLQNAILTQGLQPKPVRPAFPWIWATPAALAAAVVFFLFMQNGPAPDQSTPQIDSHPDLTAMLNQDDIVLTGSFASFEGQSAVAPASNENEVKPEPSKAASRSVVSEPERVVSLRHPKAKRSGIDASPQSELALAPSAPSANEVSMEPSVEPVKKSDSLVLIQSQADGNTGAKNAVEVHQTADVIVSS